MTCSKKRVDLCILAFHGASDRRIVQDNDFLFCSEVSKCFPQSQSVVHAFLYKGFDQRFAPRTQHLPIESASEPAYSGKADAINLNTTTIEESDANAFQRGLNFRWFPGF